MSTTSGGLISLLEAANALWGGTENWAKKSRRVRRQKALRYFRECERQRGKKYLVHRTGGTGALFVSQETMDETLPFTRYVDTRKIVVEQAKEIRALQLRVQQQDSLIDAHEHRLASLTSEINRMKRAISDSKRLRTDQK